MTGNQSSTELEDVGDTMHANQATAGCQGSGRETRALRGVGIKSFVLVMRECMVRGGCNDSSDSGLGSVSTCCKFSV